MLTKLLHSGTLSLTQGIALTITRTSAIPIRVPTMEDNTKGTMVPPGKEETETTTSLSPQSLNSPDSNDQAAAILQPKTELGQTTGGDTESKPLVEDSAENANACANVADVGTDHEVISGNSQEGILENVQMEYSGPRRQGREGLQRAIDDLRATEIAGNSDENPDTQPSSPYDESCYLQVPYLPDDEPENTDADLQETLGYGKPDKGKGKATDNDWSEEELIPHEERNDNE